MTAHAPKIAVSESFPLGLIHDMNKPVAPDQIEISDANFMRLAIEQAQLAASSNEVPVGAVLVCEGQVVAFGHNSPIRDSDPCAHAEINTLRAAGRHFKNYRLEHCQLYVTLEPCPMCMGAILQARVSEVIYALSDPKMGACGSVINLHEPSPLNAHTHVRQLDDGGIRTDCKQMLQTFFRSKRKAPNLRLSTIAHLEDLPNMDKTLAALLRAQGITSPLNLQTYSDKPLENMLAALNYPSPKANQELFARIKALHHFIAGGNAISWKACIGQDQTP